jgi:hypothetical protein
MYYLFFINYIKFYGANIFNVFILNRMSGRKIKHTVRGFLNAASRIVPGAHSLFQGSSSSHSRQKAWLRHARPELHDRPITLQRSSDVNVYVIDLICHSLIYKCVLHVSISCP